MKPFDWRRHLQPGEMLIWQGRPYPALALVRPTSAEMLIGALGAVAVAAILIVDRALSHPGEASTRPVIFLGLLLAALLVAGLPFRAMRQRSLGFKRIAYALTDRRALIGNSRNPADIQSRAVPKHALPMVDPEPHGLSTLHFGPDSLRFAHVKDAGAVAELIRAVR